MGIKSFLKDLLKKRRKMGLDELEIKFTLPLLNISGRFTPNAAEKMASWELYVELITRISVAELKDNEGILREALNSLYAIFQVTRDILKKYGPEIATPRKEGEYSFGKLAVIILNHKLRPFLTKWHPLLQEYEAKRPPDVSIKEHEERWEKNDEMRKELKDLRKLLSEYAKILAQAAGVEFFLKDEDQFYSKEFTEE